MHLKAIRGVPWTIASYGATKAVNVITTIVLARIVSPADFGLVALATMALNLLAFVKDFGFAETMVSRHDLDRRQLGTILTLVNLLSLGLATVAALSAPLLARFFGEPHLTPVLQVMAVLLLVSGTANYYETVLEREMEFRRRFVALGLQSVATAVVAIPAAILGAGVWSLVAGQLAGLVTLGVVCYALAPYHVRPAWKRDELRPLFSTSSGFLLQNVSIFGRQNLDYIVVGRSFGSAAVGFYSMAFRLADLPYWAISDPVARVTFPSFSRTHGEGGDIRPTFLSVSRLVALVSCPVGVILSGAAGPFTATVFGSTWMPMVGPLAVLGIWAAIRPIDTTLNWFLNSIGHARVVGVYSTVVIAVLLPAFILAAHLGSITTVAWVVTADSFASLVFLILMVRRRGEVGYGDQRRSLQPVVLACFPTWIASRAVSEAFSDGPALAVLVAATVAGLAAYLVALVVLEPGLIKESLRQIGRTVGRGEETADEFREIDPEPAISTEI
ncbi:MAG: lipopolysaccharide biosynthesis protein [Solirubrobacterales bacterium]